MKDELKKLIVRIQNEQKKTKGSGLLYIQNENTAYVLTAAHVLNEFSKDDVILIQCWPDVEAQDSEDQYILKAYRTDARSMYGMEKCPKGEWIAEDAAIIRLDISTCHWMKSRCNDRYNICFAEDDFDLTNRNLIGGGYSHCQETEPICQAVTIFDPEKSKCVNYDKRSQEKMRTWELLSLDGFQEIGIKGMSGSILAVEEDDQIVLVGIFLGHEKGTPITRIQGADLSCMRKLLAAEEISVRINGCVEPNTVQNRNRSVPQIGVMPGTPMDTILKSRETELNSLKQIIDRNSLTIICGIPGIGKTTVAYALGKRLSSRTCRYLKYVPSDEKQQMIRRTIEEAYFPDTEESFDKRLRLLEQYADQLVLVIDDYSGACNMDDLQEDESFRRLYQLTESGMKLVLVANGKPTNAGYEIEPLNAETLWKIWKSQCEGKITEEKFTEIVRIVGGHTEVVKLIVAYLADTLGLPNITEILEYIREGRFDKLGVDKHIDTYIRTKFKLDDCLPILQLAACMPEDGMDTELFVAGLTAVEQEITKKCISCGWIKERDDMLMVPAIIRLLSVKEHGDTACKFAQSIWEKTVETISKNPIRAGQFAQYLSAVRNGCLRHQWENCRGSKCWVYAAEAYLWQCSHNKDKKRAVEQQLFEEMKSDIKNDTFNHEYLLLDGYINGGNTHGAAIFIDAICLVSEHTKIAANDEEKKRFFKCWYEKGILHEKNGETQDAKKAFLRSIEWSTSNAEKLLAYGRIAAICDRDGSPDAIEYYNYVSVIYKEIANPNEKMQILASAAFARMGDEMLRRKENMVAKSYYCDAVACAPKSQTTLLAHCYSFLAICCERQYPDVAAAYATEAMHYHAQYRPENIPEEKRMQFKLLVQRMERIIKKGSSGNES